MAHKRLIAFMLMTMLATSTITGCEVEKTEEEIGYEDEIRQMLEYDANINLLKDRVKNHGFRIDYEINNGKFYITFSTIVPGVYGSNLRHDSIKYEVDKDFYYDFKNNYNSHETQNEVERVKNLTEKYDPVDVVDARN